MEESKHVSVSASTTVLQVLKNISWSYNYSACNVDDFVKHL